jgi:hypothetical protein
MWLTGTVGSLGIGFATIATMLAVLGSGLDTRTSSSWGRLHNGLGWLSLWKMTLSKVKQDD